MITDVKRNYIFPRVPLNFLLPENYPNAGNISNVSVVPEVKSFRFIRNEMEIHGSYSLIVSYYKADAQTDLEPEVYSELSDDDDFFSHLKMQADGLFADGSEKTPSKQNNSELYSVNFSRPFHTFVDLEFVNRPRNFKPGITVENVNLETVDGRLIKGDLVLGLINRNRGNF